MKRVLDRFNRHLSRAERAFMDGLSTPGRIQAFLDEIPYSAEAVYRCPLQVLRDRKAHCFDGALFAAAALRRFGRPALILDMLPNERDDDHVLALFRRGGRWGAVAKSNFVGLRFREPVYRNLRELVMSYFEHFYNVEREKTLRGYTGSLDLREFDAEEWMWSDRHLEKVARRLDRLRRYALLPKGASASLSPLDDRSYRAGLLGSNAAGLFRPPGRG